MRCTYEATSEARPRVQGRSVLGTVGSKRRSMVPIQRYSFDGGCGSEWEGGCVDVGEREGALLLLPLLLLLLFLSPALYSFSIANE
jgi:hypothetical protein